MSVKKTRYLLLACGVLLAACSVENCGDPSQDGLGTALGCTLSSDGYQAQTDALAAELAQKQSLAAELRAENARIQGRLASLNAQERQAANRLVGVNNQIATLDDQLNRQLRQQQISQAQYDPAQSQLHELISRRSDVDGTDPADLARLEALESEIADLEQLF